MRKRTGRPKGYWTALCAYRTPQAAIGRCAMGRRSGCGDTRTPEYDSGLMDKEGAERKFRGRRGARQDTVELGKHLSPFGESIE